MADNRDKLSAIRSCDYCSLSLNSSYHGLQLVSSDRDQTKRMLEEENMATTNPLSENGTSSPNKLLAPNVDVDVDLSHSFLYIPIFVQ
jgi:hypothetical protein